MPEYIIETKYPKEEMFNMPPNIKGNLIRCKDCKYYRNNHVAPCKKVLRSEDADENWFCAEGKRKE